MRRGSFSRCKNFRTRMLSELEQRTNRMIARRVEELGDGRQRLHRQFRDNTIYRNRYQDVSEVLAWVFSGWGLNRKIHHSHWKRAGEEVLRVFHSS